MNSLVSCQLWVSFSGIYRLAGSRRSADQGTLHSFYHFPAGQAGNVPL